MISFCLKTHPGLRVEIPAILNVSTNGSSIGAILANVTGFDQTDSVSSSSGSNSGKVDEGSEHGDTPPAPTVDVSREGSPSKSSISFGSRLFQRPAGRLISSAYRGGKGANIVDNWQETYGQPHEAFFYVELVCNVWFIIELMVRLVVSRAQFFFSI